MGGRGAWPQGARAASSSSSSAAAAAAAVAASAALLASSASAAAFLPECVSFQGPSEAGNQVETSRGALRAAWRAAALAARSEFFFFHEREKRL